MKPPLQNPIIRNLLFELDTIEQEMKKIWHWKTLRSAQDDYWLPLDEWITIVMMPKDRAFLFKWEIPENHSVGDMALCDFKKIPQTEYLTKLLIGYQNALKKNQKK